MLDLLRSLSEAIWETYQHPLTALLAQQPLLPDDAPPPEDHFSFDDDIPFRNVTPEVLNRRLAPGLRLPHETRCLNTIRNSPRTSRQLRVST